MFIENEYPLSSLVPLGRYVYSSMSFLRNSIGVENIYLQTYRSYGTIVKYTIKFTLVL